MKNESGQAAIELVIVVFAFFVAFAFAALVIPWLIEISVDLVNALY